MVQLAPEIPQSLCSENAFKGAIDVQQRNHFVGAFVFSCPRKTRILNYKIKAVTTTTTTTTTTTGENMGEIRSGTVN